MTEPTRQEVIAQKLSALKTASGQDAKKLKAELAVAVFDQNKDGLVDNKDTNLDKWRGGLGMMPDGSDMRNDVARALGIENMTRKEDLKERIVSLQNDAGMTNTSREAATPADDLKKAIEDYKAALNNRDKTAPSRSGSGKMIKVRDEEKVDTAKKALLKRFFDFDGDGVISKRDVAISVDQIQNWQTLTKDDPKAPSATDIRVIEGLVGMRIGNSPIKVTPEEVLEKLKKAGLETSASMDEPSRPAAPSRAQSPRTTPAAPASAPRNSDSTPSKPTGEPPMAEEPGARNTRLNDDIKAVEAAKKTEDKADDKMAQTKLIKDALDRDGDGKITQQEAASVIRDLKTVVGADKNKDGKLSRDEAKGMENLPSGRPRVLLEVANALKENGVDVENDRILKIGKAIKEMGVEISGAEPKGGATQGQAEPQGRGGRGGRGGRE